MIASQTQIKADPGKAEVLITREFDAPRELVFKVVTDGNLIPKWWGPAYLETTVDKYDIKPGGSWRIVQKDPNGPTHGFHGVVHSVDAPERVVQTFEYEGAPGHVTLDTLTLEDLGNGRTRYVAHSVFQSLEDRDAMVASGMESGVLEMMDRLQTLLDESK